MSGVLRVEIVTVGTELLLGDVEDGNGGWLSRRLASLGAVVTRRTTVGDDDAAIRAAVGDALARAAVVVCTGGLGPTEDDRTREAVAAIYGWPLRRDAAVLETVRERLAAHGVEMTAGNAKQAEVPEGADVLQNAGGTAPGLILEGEPGTTILLPGVPREMKAMFDARVAPYLVARGAAGAPVRSRTLRTCGIAESTLADKLAGLEAEIAPLGLAYLPGAEGVDLRLTSWALRERAAAVRLATAERRIRERVGRWVYGRDDADLAAAVGERLRAAGWMLAVAESCTGGLLGKRLTDAAGASGYFTAGFTSYADAAKTRLLGVPTDLIRRHGAVSGPVAARMAQGARRRARTEAALSITGIAGPSGGSADKPVGTTWIALAVPGRTAVRRYLLPGDRAEIRARAAQAALHFLWARLGDPAAERDR